MYGKDDVIEVTVKPVGPSPEFTVDTITYGCKHVVEDTDLAMHKSEVTVERDVAGFMVNIPVEYYSCGECGVPEQFSVL